jgi:hypothetical protein
LWVIADPVAESLFLHHFSLVTWDKNRNSPIVKQIYPISSSKTAVARRIWLLL